MDAHAEYMFLRPFYHLDEVTVGEIASLSDVKDEEKAKALLEKDYASFIEKKMISHPSGEFARYSLRPDAKEKFWDRMHLLAGIADLERENVILSRVTFQAIELGEFTAAELGAETRCAQETVEKLLNGELASFFTRAADDESLYSLDRSNILPLIDHFKKASEQTQTQVTAYTAQLALTLT